MDKLSYALGLGIGQQLVQMGAAADMNIDDFAAGLWQQPSILVSSPSSVTVTAARTTEERNEILVKVNTMLNELCPQVSLYQNQKL